MELKSTQGKNKIWSHAVQNRKILLHSLAVLMILGFSFAINYWLDKPPQPAAQSQQPTANNRPELLPPKIELVPFASGLNDPTAIVSLAGNDRLFVLDRSGLVRIVQPDGTVLPTPFLDISSRVLGSDEMGLLGMAFSPNYSKDGNFYIYYNDKSQNSVLARYHATSADSADPASEQRLLVFKQPYTNHSGGSIVFGPDGYLYIAFGDGGSQGDPQNRSQDLKSMFGKILRLDVSQTPYKIPASNPFVSKEDSLAEIWAYGLRNPWRISFDRQTKDLYIADVGAGDIEEIDIEPASGKGGINYGWRCFEGSRDFNLDGCGGRDQYTFPALEYDHSDGRCSITGGYAYRGKKYPALAGKYIYGDYCGGQVYSADKKDGKLETSLAVKSEYQISTFGEDSNGEIYMADFAAGNIYQIQDSAN